MLVHLSVCVYSEAKECTFVKFLTEYRFMFNKKPGNSQSAISHADMQVLIRDSFPCNCIISNVS